MPTPLVFNAFKADLANGVHDLDAHSLKVALTNTPPTAVDGVLAHISQISAGNGYTAGGAAIAVTSSAQSGGTYSLTLGAATFTASGGAMAGFRYAVLYNDTATGDPLICWFDIGAVVTLADTQVYQINAGTWLTNA